MLESEDIEVFVMMENMLVDFDFVDDVSRDVEGVLEVVKGRKEELVDNVKVREIR